MSTIRDINLKNEGHERINWVARHMPILNAIQARFRAEQPLKGLRITLSVHLEAKTAYLVKTLVAGGATLSVTGSNPRSTQDAVCAALVDDGIEVNAMHGISHEEAVELWKKALEIRPHIIVDDGADLMHLLLGDSRHLAGDMIGGCEETTSGVQRLRGWQDSGRLVYPALSINDARCKTNFDNVYGTGQTIFDAIMRTTNLLINGKTVVIAGYGYCGHGIAHVARGLGAQVIVTECDPIRSVQAVMDGNRAMKMIDAAPLGDIFITATASVDVIRKEHFAVMKNDAIVMNAGHFNDELDIPALKAMAVEVLPLRRNLDGYRLADGRTIALVANGGLANIAAADGNPIEIMDMSFALQALGTEYMAKHGRTMEPGVYPIPQSIDFEVGSLALASLGGSFDTMSERQKAYIASH
ncbi:MAG TPA: adenosylhomocysteinase [Clostridiaceae bacterium]|nr:adenosylhomocysteinase [Clostridiaceae bacterium]